MTFIQNTWGVCFRMSAFDLFVHHVCGSHWCVCFMFVWKYIYISFACLTNALWGTSTLYMKCMSATLNAHSLYLTHLCPVWCVCWIDVVVSWGKHTLTLTRAHTHWETHEGTVMTSRVSLTMSSFPPTGRCGSGTMSWCHCRTQSSTDSSPWCK